LITSGKSVEAGTSGAVSLAGTLAAAAGSALIAGLAWTLSQTGEPVHFWQALLILLAGLFGCMVDSWLGATLQAIYFCPVCQKETEKHPRHHCGMETTLLRGKIWMNNEWVNLFCSLGSSLLMICLGFLVKIF
jgi:uncharacterized membrane protein